MDEERRAEDAAVQEALDITVHAHFPADMVAMMAALVYETTGEVPEGENLVTQSKDPMRTAKQLLLSWRARSTQRDKERIASMAAVEVDRTLMVSRLRAEINTLNEQKREKHFTLHGIIKEKDGMLEVLRAGKAQLERECMTFQTACNDARSAVVDAGMSLKRKQSRLDDALRTVHVLQGERRSLMVESEQYAGTASALRVKNDEQAERIRELYDRAGRSEDVVQEANRDLDVARAEHERLCTKVGELEKKREEQARMLGILHGDVERVRGANQGLRNQLAKRERELHDARQYIEDQNDEHKLELGAAVEEKVELGNEVATLRMAYNGLEEHHVELQRRSEREHTDKLDAEKARDLAVTETETLKRTYEAAIANHDELLTYRRILFGNESPSNTTKMAYDLLEELKAAKRKWVTYTEAVREADALANGEPVVGDTGLDSEEPLPTTRPDRAAAKEKAQLRGGALWPSNCTPGMKFDGDHYWTCTIGPMPVVPESADSPMRHAVHRAFAGLFKQEAPVCFSGWGEKLTPVELEVVQEGVDREALGWSKPDHDTDDLG